MTKEPSIILGISYGHGDSSAALIIENQLVAAAEEERFNRIKHYAHFPEQAIKYCLSQAGISPSQVEVLAIAKTPWNQFLYKMSLVLAHPNLIKRTKPKTADPKIRFSKQVASLGLTKAKIKRIEHHLAHLYSCRYLTPSEMAYLSLDGLGDFVSAAAGKSNGHKIEILDRLRFPHSLGFFYTAITHYLGFPHYGDEFKVMGLSAFGSPKYISEMRNLIRKNETFGCSLNLEAFPILTRPISYFIQNSQPRILPFYNTNYLRQLLGFGPRKPKDPILQAHKDLAYSAQLCFEEMANHLLFQLHKKVPVDTVALSGGCAHNSVWVGQIPQNTPFKKVVVAPASHDAGIAVGAAIAVANREISPSSGDWGLMGPSFDKEISELKTPDQIDELEFADEKKLIHWATDELRSGKILGVFSGRMEFGPRALGNRSILADPSHPDMKDKLNARVKHRESFRPFAASVLTEYQSEWFENVFHSPTMEAVFKVKTDKIKQIPSVVHANNSCRIQTVTQQNQPFYWKLIDAFRKKTGIPMLINTSFNDCEPIVCSVEDAIRCFLNSEMDYLILGHRAFSKKAEAARMVG